MEKDVLKKKAELDKIEKKKEKAEEVLKEKKKEYTRLSREMSKIEQDIREKVGNCGSVSWVLFIGVLMNNLIT